MTLVYFVVLVGVLIFVHELGHFLFAKLFDVKVLKFSLGFGPRALSFNGSETEYRVSWIPLGGYVKMLGEDPNDELRREDQGRAFHKKPLWQRYIIVFAGPAFNIIFPTLIYCVFFAAKSSLPPAVIGKVFGGQPAAEAGLLPGDRIVEVGNHDIRYWEELQRYVSNHPGEPLKMRIERDGQLFYRFITPKEHTRRDPLGFVDRFGLIGISPFFELPQIGVSEPTSAAARAGLRTGDLVASVNGRTISRWAELEQLLKRNRGQALRVSFLRPSDSMSTTIDLRVLEPHTTIIQPDPVYNSGSVSYSTGLRSAEFFVQVVEHGSPAENIGMRPGDCVVEFDGKPVTHWEMIELALQAEKEAQHEISWIAFGGQEKRATFRLSRVKQLNEYQEEQVQYVFGAHNRLLWKSADAVPVEDRFAYAVTESVRKTSEVVTVMALAIVQLFRGAISGDSIGGPVMLAYTARAAADKGWDHFLWMMALLSINLGIINVLPIPILDGGHIMFFTLEAVRRRPLSLRARELASYVGLVLLVSLMAFALKNDIVRYWFR